jgi:hypothetical protein
MATVTANKIATPEDGPSCAVWRWTSVNGGDTCNPVVVGRYSDKTVQFYSANAFAGNMSIAGTCNPDLANATYVTLTDAQGNDIANKTNSCIEVIQEGCYAIKPVVGANVAAVAVYLICQSAR